MTEQEEGGMRRPRRKILIQARRERDEDDSLLSLTAEGMRKGKETKAIDLKPGEEGERRAAHVPHR